MALLDSVGLETPSVSQLKERFEKLNAFAKVENARDLEGLPANSFRRASVLIPLFYKNSELRILLTKRSEDLTHHAGFVAFPGGMQDDADRDEVEAALREADEEIGLKPSNVEVVAILPHSIVRPNTIVTPVLGLIPEDFVPTPNEAEVELVFDLPLYRFLSKERLRVTDSTFFSDVVYHVHHFIDHVGPGREVDTWGYTAAVCAETAVVAYNVSTSTLCFHGDFIVTNDTAFKSLYFRKVLARMTKSKL